MSDDVCVGVVGLGYWGPNLARNFSALEGCELRWCCDASAAARERWAKSFPSTRFSADLEELLERMLPRDDRYVHRHGARGHGGDHLLPALVSPSLVLPVDGGELVLGTWQSIVIVDPNRDNDRRRVRVAVLPG